MIDKQTMLDRVYAQLSVDYNCSPGDFLKDGLIFTAAKDIKGRRPFPWRSPRVEMVTMGRGAVINASEDVMPFVREQLEGRTRDEAFCAPFMVGLSPYFLPDVDRIAPLVKPDGFEYEMLERQDIPALYDTVGFGNAIRYGGDALRPDMLAAVARHKGEIVAMAGASADCEAMWQIGVDVLPPYRGRGLASAMVNALTLEILDRGYVPYYGADGSNVASMRVAVKAGYMPAWVHRWRTRPGAWMQAR